MSEYCKNCYELKEQLNQLKARNDELNKQIEILKMQLKSLNEKFSRKRAVIEFADCPYYSYGDNTIEPTCNKNFCYDVKFCDHKNMVKLKQTLTEIKEIATALCYSAMTDGVVILQKDILKIIDEVE